jgi:hypothetical protein
MTPAQPIRKIITAKGEPVLLITEWKDHASTGIGQRFG